MFESLFKAATEEKKKPEDEVNHQKKKVKKRKSGKKKSKNETSPKTETIEMKPQKKPTINKVKNDQKYSKKQKAPSPEALELSAKLKQLCQQKNLSEAIKIFNAPSNKALLDGHHLCIMVDLYGRCGNIAQGQELVDNWEGPINIQTKTALMKGYCHCGALEQAEELYLDMLSCGKSNRHERPNVRTLNTLLRGCLWAAVNINKEKKSEMSGGVVTADSIWPSKTKGTGGSFIIPDLSSYEYYISLLCQSLRCDDASRILNDFIEKFQVKENFNRSYTAADPNALETLAISYYNLSKAYVLLGQFGKAKTCTDKVHHISSSLRQMKSGNGSIHQNKKVQGGKRAWRQDEISDRRIVSNSLFREHKLSELETNTKALQEIMSKSHNDKKFDAKMYARQNAREMICKVLYFSGGGTTDLSAANQSRLSADAKSRDYSNMKRHLINAQWYSFGLQMLMQVAFPQEQIHRIESGERNPTPLSQQDCSKILKLLKLDPNYVLHEDGTVNFSRVFDRPIHSTNNLNIELGSGFGEFAINQALANPNAYYLATEMRSDRVGQMNTLNILSSLHNLASIGTECGNFLKDRIQEGSINTIYCNHPEPPTQTFGANNSLLKLIASGKAEEPAHMLNSKTLLSAGLCLHKDNGRLVIVTDNRWYANLICSSILLVMKDRPNLFHQVPLNEGFTKLETFFGSSHSSVDLYEGQPSQTIGHSIRSSKGTTFFDKLWRKNAGKHADSSKRFVICVSRSAISKPTENKGSKKRKRSLSRQQARNERRMKKKLEESS